MSNPQSIALITGGNRGIGFEIARLIGQSGRTVLIGSRDLRGGEQAAEALRKEGVNAHAVRLDVTDEASAESCRALCADRFGGLDALVNNAAVLLDHQGSAQAIDAAALRQTFQANVEGAVRATSALLPMLKASPAGRIVNVSSTIGSFGSIASGGVMDGPAYMMSKAALNMWTLVLSRELAGTRVKVNAACPGWCRTGMGGQAAPRTAAEGADTPFWLATLPDDGPTGGFFRDRRRIEW